MMEQWVRMLNKIRVVNMVIIKRLVVLIMHKLVVIIQRIVVNNFAVILIVLGLKIFLELIFWNNLWLFVSMLNLLRTFLYEVHFRLNDVNNRLILNFLLQAYFFFFLSFWGLFRNKVIRVLIFTLLSIRNLFLKIFFHSIVTEK